MAAVSGTFSEGLSTKAFPRVTAMGNIHIGTMAGKLKGTMPATTPSGSRRNSQVIPRLTSMIPPRSMFWIPSANSHTSTPFSTSARASANVFPDSAAAEWESSSRFARRSSRNLNMRWERSFSGVAAQSGWAFFAASTTRATSAARESGTLPMTAPV
jgi:hypothetical protein